ncbi:trypsin-like serine protease [Micrococcus sp.]|uniref:trypsin-like serine protease n=1 Tax=Micrococcus sp. TaxID=1271 RepID=UPI002A919BAF|nr:trypsin-like serine protease [Micrococcus sp.]MDY6055099.1 trypsin-like serine protease [Micrococcus sp.]
MNSRTLSGAATVALGAVVVTGAAPALAATPLTQGAALATPAGACSLTIVSDSTAYTAAHCGAGRWAVGSPVLSAEGVRVGTVAALPAPGGVDVVRIALDQGVEVVGDWSTRPASSVAVGETVYTHGSSVPLGRPNSISHTRAFDSAAVCRDSYDDQVALDVASTYPGDSGGAVYDAEQRVVGVISGVAPVRFDAQGRAVACDAQAMSTIIVPAESLAEVTEKTPAPARAPKHAAPKHAAPALTTPAPAPKHAAQAPAPKSAVKAPARAPKHALPADGVTTLVAAPAEGVAFNTRVVVETPQGGFSRVTVTAHAADGTDLGRSHLDLQGEPLAWLPVMADVPAGGHVTITTWDAAGAPTATTATLGGVPVS